MRKEKGERSGGKGGAWPHLRCRFHAETTADASNSSEEFRRPGGVSCRSTKGRWRRMARGLYRCGAGKKRAGIKREIIRGGELLRGGNGHSVVFERRRETGLTRGAHMSARGRENRGYRFGLS
jgi:hypothetical protein